MKKSHVQQKTVKGRRGRSGIKNKHTITDTMSVAEVEADDEVKQEEQHNNNVKEHSIQDQSDDDEKEMVCVILTDRRCSTLSRRNEISASSPSC